jgi:signal transduction histidine kinase
MTLQPSHQNGAIMNPAFNAPKNSLKQPSLSQRIQGLPHTAEDYKTRFWSVFNLGPSAKIVVSKTLELVHANNKFKVWFSNYFVEPVSQLNLSEMEIFDSQQLLAIEKYVGDTSASQDFETICTLQLHNGAISNIKTTICSVPEDSNIEELFVLEMNDITELEQSKTGWSESTLLLQKKDTDLRKLVRVISHDLRGPSLNVSNLIGLLEKTSGNDVDPMVISGLKTSVNAILQTIDTTVEGLNSSMEPLPNDYSHSIKSVLEDILNELRADMSFDDIAVELQSYDASDWQVSKELLKMVLSQLISNSIKYRRDDIEGRITISAFKQNGKRTIKVVDNGRGINLKGQEQRLFGLFQTFHNHAEARGVGLFQVKNRMKSVGGDVLLESEVNKGTAITLNFN